MVKPEKIINIWLPSLALTVWIETSTIKTAENVIKFSKQVILMVDFIISFSFKFTEEKLLKSRVFCSQTLQPKFLFWFGTQLEGIAQKDFFFIQEFACWQCFQFEFTMITDSKPKKMFVFYRGFWAKIGFSKESRKKCQHVLRK